jgi:type VI secretion system secreted protein Hcp
MAVDMFLELDGVQGESKDKQFKDKIDIFSFSLGLSNSGAGHYGGGSGAGKGQISDISIGKLVDKSSATLYGFCYKGKHIDNGIVHIRKAAGDTPLEYLKYEMTEVFITSVNTSDSAGGGIANESISLNFSKIKMTYQLQADTGGEQANPEVTINVKENTVEQG